MNEPRTEKRCARCDTVKKIDSFYRSNKSFDGHAYWCKQCSYQTIAARWASMTPEELQSYNFEKKLYRHNTTLEDYNKLLEKQNYVCASCGTSSPGGKSKHFLIDHNHKCCPGYRSCGKCVRGLLCVSCNLVAGTLESSKAIQVREYLDKYDG